MVNRIRLQAITALLVFAWANVHVVADLKLPANRGFGRAAVVKHHIYYFGGGSSAIEILDVKRARWSRGSLGMSSSQLLGDQIGGRLYVVDPISRKFVSFDPRSKRIQRLSNVPTPRVNGTVIAFAEKLYVMGGYSKDITRDNCVEVYDPKTKQWQKGPPLPGYQQLDHFHSAAVLNGKLHVVGGFLKNSADGQPHWRLDGNHWEERAEPPLCAMWKHCVLVAAAGKLYLIAPYPISTKNESIKVENNVFAYEPTTNRWQPIGRTPKSMPIGLFAQAVVGNKIYVLGGVGSNAVYVFDVATRKWE